MTDDIVTRVQRMEVIEAGRALVAQYADRVDTVDLDGLRALFTDGMVLTMPGRSYDGADAVIGFYRDRLGADSAMGRHFVTNTHVVSASTEAVTLRSMFLYTAGDNGRSLLGWGRYLDQLAMVDGVLKFVAKDITVEHRGPVEATWGARPVGSAG